MTRPSNDPADTERLFAEHLAVLPDGAAPDPDSLAAAHPEHANTLRALCDHWRLSQTTLYDPRQSVQVTGDGIDGSAWQAFIEQLHSRGPAHTGYILKGEIARGGMGVIQQGGPRVGTTRAI